MDDDSPRNPQISKALLKIARAVTWPVRPGPSFGDGALKLAAWSLLATTYFLFVGELMFPGGSFQFTDYAEALIQGAGGPHLDARDAGYPLLLLATGYHINHSFVGLILAQAAMAWAMPLLVYGAVGHRFHGAAFLAGLATIVSMSPYLFMKMIHHDQPYVFLSLLTIFLTIRFLHTVRIRYLYLAIAALIATSLTRPAGNLLALPLLLLLWFFRPASWRHYLLCAIIVSLCALAYADHRSRLFEYSMQGNVPSFTGRQLFYNLYVNSADYGVRVDESLGPATSRLFSRARDEVKAGLDGERMNIWYRSHNFPEAAKKFWFTRFDGKEDAFIESMIKHPSNDYYEFFCLIETSDQVFLRSTMEIVRAYPLYPVRVTLRNLRLFLWTPGYTHGRMGLSFNSIAPEGLQFYPLHGFVVKEQIEQFVPAPGKLELLSPDPPLILALRAEAKLLEVWWTKYYRPVNKIAFVLAVIAFAGMLFGDSSFRTSAAVTWLFFLYNALATSAFVEPNYRYHFFVLPMLFILAGLGAGIIFAAAANVFVRLAGARAPWSWIDATFGGALRSSKPVMDQHFNNQQRMAWLALALIAGCVAVSWAYLIWLQSNVGM